MRLIRETLQNLIPHAICFLLGHKYLIRWPKTGVLDPVYCCRRCGKIHPVGGK